MASRCLACWQRASNGSRCESPRASSLKLQQACTRLTRRGMNQAARCAWCTVTSRRRTSSFHATGTSNYRISVLPRPWRTRAKPPPLVASKASSATCRPSRRATTSWIDAATSSLWASCSIAACWANGRSPRPAKEPKSRSRVCSIQTTRVRVTSTLRARSSLPRSSNALCSENQHFAINRQTSCARIWSSGSSPRAR